MCPLPQHGQLQQQSVPKCFPLYQVQVDFFSFFFLGELLLFFSSFFVGLWEEEGGVRVRRKNQTKFIKTTQVDRTFINFFLAPFSSLIPQLFIINIAPHPPPPFLSFFFLCFKKKNWAFFSIPLFFSPHTFAFGTCIQNTYIHSFYIILSVHRYLSVFHHQNI